MSVHFENPTPLVHADNQRYGHQRGAISHHKQSNSKQASFAISDGSSNDTAVAFTSGAWDMLTTAVATTSRVSGSGLSPSVASTSTEQEISCLEAISPIHLNRKRKPSGCKKQTSD
ncbi:hypothetical protein TNIN_372881 [Trichonephila inaurata madagascariensis]|uniref:Uncharacterized protein n=1 Tax=Trichonephila inaurata madagascariensis TaxID=2747483 RepID=A0A8X6YFN1_9ARAC|nr:hypothetical protein TNIN_372881 [Trichonephila inaurata madagascariensis]